MHYIIDANNLAGKLEILSDKDFDRTLINKVASYFAPKKIKVILIFDGSELMGDKFQQGNIAVIRTPKDSYYNSADDMILEQVENHFCKNKDELIVVTDDQDLIRRISESNKVNKRKLFFKSSQIFADKIFRLEKNGMADTTDDHARGLSQKEEATISRELLDLWD